MNEESEIEKLLKEVSQIIDLHEKHSNTNGENFNIFKILRMQRKEVETHSRFIYELLNTRGSHGQGDIFLKLFFEYALQLDNAVNIYNPKREDLTINQRRIDFTIESDNYMVGIEMKINANDQKEQLFDYHKELKKRANGREVKLFYLTLDGKEASKESLKSLTESDYERISFQNEIIEWLDACIKEMSLKHVIREALLQYKILIELLTGQRRGVQMEIAETLISSQNNLKAAINIEKSVLEAKIKHQLNFWEELTKRLNSEVKLKKINIIEYSENLSKNKIEIKNLVTDYYKKNKKENKFFGLKFLICNYKGYEIWGCIRLFSRIHYGLRLNKNNQFIEDNKIRGELRERFGKGNAIDDDKLNWIICFYDNNNGDNKITFEKDKFNDIAISLVDKKEMEKITTSIVEHINELINKLPKP